MSEQITIEKEVTVQVDYVQCEVCDRELDFRVKSYYCSNLQIYVSPCDCLEGGE